MTARLGMAWDSFVWRARGFRTVPIATRDQIPAGGVFVTTFQGEPLMLIDDPREIFPIFAVCTHDDACPLEWDAGTRQLRCPCHGCVFDSATWLPVKGPAHKSLRMYQALVRGNQVSLVYPPNNNSSTVIYSYDRST